MFYYFSAREIVIWAKFWYHILVWIMWHNSEISIVKKVQSKGTEIERYFRFRCPLFLNIRNVESETFSFRASIRNIGFQIFIEQRSSPITMNFSFNHMIFQVKGYFVVCKIASVKVKWLFSRNCFYQWTIRNFTFWSYVWKLNRVIRLVKTDGKWRINIYFWALIWSKFNFVASLSNAYV